MMLVEGASRTLPDSPTIDRRGLRMEIEESAADPSAWAAAGLRKSAGDVQVHRATIVVDLDRDEDAMLASFKPKTRYNIRLAARRGVVVEPVAMTDANIATMYSLMSATSEYKVAMLAS